MAKTVQLCGETYSLPEVLERLKRDQDQLVQSADEKREESARLRNLAQELQYMRNVLERGIELPEREQGAICQQIAPHVSPLRRR